MAKKKNPFISMFKRLFVRDDAEISVLEEEALRTPGKTVFLNLVHNKLAIIGFVGFVAVMLFSFVGSALRPLPPNYTELTNSNLRPGTNYLIYPDSLNSKEIVKIVSGVSYSVALTADGELTAWGTEKNRYMRNISEPMLTIPQEIQDLNIVDIESGSAHIIVLDDQGDLYGWGYHNMNQTSVPLLVQQYFMGGFEKIKKLGASTSWSAILSDLGYLYVWGSSQAQTNFLVPLETADGRKVDGNIEDFAYGDNNMVLLLKDGTLVSIGAPGTEVMMNLPVELTDGSVQVTDVAATNRAAMAIDANGKLYVWGGREYGLTTIPDTVQDGNVAFIDGCYKNFTAVTKQGEVVTWGSNELKQLEQPEGMTGVSKVFGDYFQMYAVNDTGKIVGAWGNKGYIWGTDQFGRDLLTRIIHGGRISLTVGAISVLISIVIAILVGLPSGYFGGWVDQTLMRLADIVSSIPFLPLAVTLSYVIGFNLEQKYKLYLIMIVMGVLGWTGLARLIRAQLLLEREKDFVLAARALGIKQSQIMIKHILPNVFNLVIVNITLGYASSLLSEAGLSFLGFGIQEPTPSWGNMLTGAQESIVIQFYWWRWVIPALFVVAAALSINLVGDALREAMDPKSNER